MRLAANVRLASCLLAVSRLSYTQPIVDGGDDTSALVSAFTSPPAASNEQTTSSSRLINLTLHNAFNGDESYTLAIDGLPLPADSDSCQPEDLANVAVNGHSLALTAPLYNGGKLPIYGTLEGTVTAIAEHSLESLLPVPLTIAARCLDSLDDTEPSQVTARKARLFNIHLTQPRGDTWYFVSVNNSPGSTGTAHVDFEVSTSRSIARWDVGSEAVSTDFFQGSSESGAIELADDALEREIHRLQVLQGELKLSIDQQKTLVSKLVSEKHQKAKEEINDCQSISCILSSLYRTGKKCIHLAYLQFKVLHDFNSRVPDDCFPMDSALRPAEAAMLLGDKKICDNHEKIYSEKLWSDTKASSASSEADKEEKRPLSSASTPSSPEIGHGPSSSSSADTKAYMFLALVASLLCLGCMGVMVQRRCCSPRARADRAARREERRTRRQYRCAARRQAWKDWWARQQGRICRRGRFSSRQTDDYEEKRALIVQQEAILENAMQHEIGRLQANTHPRGVVGEVLTMAEEGRMPPLSLSTESQTGNNSGSTEQLPAYRSRASSGRPPSYREFDESASSTVVDGFTDYAPSYNGNDDDDGRSAVSVRSFASNGTPASSVVELSPRHSFETLRTERSVV